MKPLCILWLVLASFTEDIPFKSNDEFEVNLDFKFRTRVKETSEVYTSTASNTSGPLPYLNISMKVLKLAPDEVKIRIINSKGQVLYTRKAAEGTIVNLDMGYTDDIKGRVSEHEYTLVFISQDKKPLSRIVIHFQEDGSYLINNEKRGKV
jgi:hypothetical protein